MPHSVVLSLVATAVLSACAAGPSSPLQVPEQLQAPAGSQLVLETNASGVQIYTCGARKTDSARYEWAFKAPQAELMDTNGRNVGKHYGGPTWESNDGSQVVGEVKARHDGPDSSAIPWLLLTAKSNNGNGVFGKIAFIQRLATEGGKAPADGCTETTADKELRVPYKAIYRYYTAGRLSFSTRRNDFIANTVGGIHGFVRLTFPFV